MRLLDQNELKHLLQQPEGVCVSIFMPTQRVRRKKQSEAQIRLKNLIREAESQLKEYLPDVRSVDVQRFLEPVSEILKDSLFWDEQKDGLAIFLSEDFFEVYRLPIELEELVKVNNRFYITPLLPMLAENGRFYILALSQNEIRLFQSTRYSTAEIEPGNIPTSLAKALAYDDPERQLQFHTSTEMSGAPGARAAIHHGHEVTSEAKNNILRYFRQVDAGLQELLKKTNTPLVLAGVDYLFPIYQEANTYPNLLDKGVSGNPEVLSAEELRHQAWDVVESHFRQAQQEAVERYGHLAHTERASDDLAAITNAARTGLVDSLFITMDSDADAASSDEDLVDQAAEQTLLHGGEVYVVPPDVILGETPAAAIFRY